MNLYLYTNFHKVPIITDHIYDKFTQTNAKHFTYYESSN